MAEQVFKKEVEWGSSREDFIGESEITVTITLREYRNLVTAVAKKEHEYSKLIKRIAEAEEDGNRWKQMYELLKELHEGECESDD